MNAAAVLVPILLAAALPLQAQITTNTALPVTKGRGIVRVQAKVFRATDDPTPMNREMLAFAFPLVGVYGLSARVAAFGVLPVLDKSVESTTPSDRVERGVTGVGDVRVFGRYTVFHRNRRGVTIRLAPFAGLELPTGVHDAEDEHGRLPPGLQPGSGSWDPFAGAVFTWQTLAWQIDVSAMYQLNTSVDDFDWGDVASFDVASKVRVFPRRLSGGVAGFGYLNLESNVIHEWETTRHGTGLSGIGGTVWFVAPGAQYITRRFVVEGAVQLPLVADLNAQALGVDMIVTLSLRVNI